MLYIVHYVSIKTYQLIICSVSIKYDLISVKIGRHVPEKKLNKTMHKVPTSPEMRASTTLGNSKCQIEPSC